MNFSVIDYIIVIVYLVDVVAFGIITSGKQKNTKDYFLSGKKKKWWAVGLSIYAIAETRGCSLYFAKAGI